MPEKAKKNPQPQKPNTGWKIYFTAEEILYLEEKARLLGFKSAQMYVIDKFRRERINAARLKK